MELRRVLVWRSVCCEQGQLIFGERKECASCGCFGTRENNEGKRVS